MGPGSRSWSWVWCCLLSLGVLTRALELEELFEFGEEAGDQQLSPGSDSSTALPLNASLFFFDETFDRVYINTNGFVAVAEPPAEREYLGNMPASFKMIAALLGDLDNSDGRGKVFFRQDSSPDVRSRASEHIRRAFPRDEVVEPPSVLIVTWVNMAAQGTSGRGDGLDAKRNTFQLVVASMESSSCAILLYPRDGLQFLSTSVGGESKVLEAGFNEGLVQGWFWNTKQGTYFRTTTDDEASIGELTEKTNCGQKGVWVYEIGASPFFVAILPGMVQSLPGEEETTTEPPVTMLPRQPDEQQEVDFSTYEIQTTMTTEAAPLEQEEFPAETPTEYQPVYPEAKMVTPEYPRPQPDEPEAETVTPGYTKPKTEELDYEEPRQFRPEYPESETVTPTYASPERVQPTYPDQTETRYPISEPLEPRHAVTEPSERRYSPDQSRYPDPDPVQTQYANPVQPVPPHSQPQHPQIVVVDEDEDLNVNVFGYNLETCAHHRHKCSAFADCRDYSNGYCCHCRPGFYGNGKDCIAEGKPQRMNGKVNGRVFVGNSPSPTVLSNNDLHSYVVANDGRAYVAISNIPDSVGPSLQPLSSLGGVIGWAFALEQPGYQNGFSLIGGVFSRQTEVIFQPGNERLSIKQQFKGIDEHDHLVVSTELEGHVPAIPLGSSVQINPYKEIYQYDRNLITSSSNRDYTITSPDGSVQTRSYQWRQTVTFQSCPHDEAAEAAPATQQLSVDQIFVMFDASNHLIRYAMSNKIGSVHSSLPEQNPCFTGRHGCDINAVCRPGEGLQFTCECAAGFAGDGRYCHDIDECRETPRVCGPDAVCSNQPGTFRCECLSGFVFASDGRTCIAENRPVDHCQRGSHDCDVPERAVCSYTGGSAYVCSCLPGFVGDGRACRDVDECQQDRCHRDAFCSNTHGSYTCQCRPGFHGDGFQCSPVSSEREQTRCERHRDSARASAASASGLFSLFRPRPAAGLYVPQCDEHGAYEPTQCHAGIGQCWCVDANGQEIPNTRTGPGSTPLCINQAVTPAPVGPTPRPDVQPVAPGTHLLFAQSGKIEHVPLAGYSMKKEEAKPLLHIPDRVVIAVAYDCVEKMVYWTDITGPAISKASLSGGDIVPVITKELQSPEGIAIDHVSRLLFWTDSMRDTVEVSKLDGSQRRVLFDTDLVNPRPIVTSPAYGRLYWADWNRDGPKIEMSNMDGTERTVLVNDDLGLPNGLTFDPDNQQLCWADAGTRKVECMDPHRRLRRQIVDGIQYPFALVSFGRNLYYTDWRREAVVAVDRHSLKETEEFLPQKRSRLYGITTTPTQCPQAFNYCANNGGCSHLCLPRLGGFTCRCPDAADGRCEERNL
ncbi:nidogen-1-like [Toxotes jaculatrix]|uniref:nidogen-1-like n=1 Tax=Toxotes jaculatrix TaxID=941984 RepID=UPI001B3A9293|nr:nidogen-1-like [Toxotes jaculatrix]